MMNIDHVRLRKHLYDIASGDPTLEFRLKKKVEDHLASCRRCARELRLLTAAVNLTRTSLPAPSDHRSSEYWDRFTSSLENRIRSKEYEQKNGSFSLRGVLLDIFLFRRRSVALLGSGLAVGIILGFIFFRHSPSPGPQPPLTKTLTDAPVTTPIQLARMQTYFRKSKTLLIGIENMKTDDEAGLDLSAERTASRELLREARYLKYQPLDNRSARLITNLERILIELANLKQETGLPGVEIIRGGIQQENLLFKIRMAEAMYDSTEFMSVNNNY